MIPNLTWETAATAALDVLATPWVQAVLLLVGGLLLVRLLAVLAHQRLATSTGRHWAFVARRLITYGGAILVFLAAGRALGLDLTALVATAGVATIAIGFAAQTSLSNLIAGLFLLVDRPFQVGDTIEMEGRQGVVQEISLLSTLVRTFDNILVRWPNEVVLKSTILNYSRYPARRVDMRVGVPYDCSIAEARAVLLQAVSDLPVVLIEPAPEVIARSFLDSAIELEVRAWVPQTEFVRGRTELVHAIHRALEDSGIGIPFPQLTLWRGDKGADGPS